MQAVVKFVQTIIQDKSVYFTQAQIIRMATTIHNPAVMIHIMSARKEWQTPV